jgi:NADH:ubiquinone oxidoreductase subunit 3 (subunit A)
VDKYLTVILIFCVVSIPISFLNPTTGEMRDPPFFLLFYASIGGICIIVIYSSYKERQQRQKLNSERRRPKK